MVVAAGGNVAFLNLGGGVELKITIAVDLQIPVVGIVRSWLRDKVIQKSPSGFWDIGHLPIQNSYRVLENGGEEAPAEVGNLG